MSIDVLGLVMAAAAQAEPPAAPPLTGERDFRQYVWAAYGAVILLLVLFTLWSVIQLRAAERRLDRIEDLVQREKGGGPAAAQQSSKPS